MSETEIPEHKHESPIQRIVVESALIVFSILLALAVNSYMDVRKQRDLTERALRGVRAEISSNLRQVNALLPYHNLLAKEINATDSAHQAKDYASFHTHAPAWHGFDNPFLDGTAWQSAIALGTLANMGYDTVRVLSSLYSVQSKFDLYMTSSLPTFDFSDAAMPSTVRRMYIYVETMRINEDTLVGRYAKALELLGATP
jgi:hypothetical protein